jgi:hypothetical protein
MHRWRKWCEVRLEDGSSLPTQADCAAAVRAPGRLRGDVLLLQVLDEHCARALPGDSTIPSTVTRSRCHDRNFGTSSALTSSTYTMTWPHWGFGLRLVVYAATSAFLGGDNERVKRVSQG